jgi:hypothetical protein
MTFFLGQREYIYFTQGLIREEILFSGANLQIDTTLSSPPSSSHSCGHVAAFNPPVGALLRRSSTTSASVSLPRPDHHIHIPSPPPTTQSPHSRHQRRLDGLRVAAGRSLAQLPATCVTTDVWWPAGRGLTTAQNRGRWGDHGDAPRQPKSRTATHGHTSSGCASSPPTATPPTRRRGGLR